MHDYIMNGFKSGLELYVPIKIAFYLLSLYLLVVVVTIVN